MIYSTAAAAWGAAGAAELRLAFLRANHHPDASFPGGRACVGSPNDPVRGSAGSGTKLGPGVAHQGGSM